MRLAELAPTLTLNKFQIRHNVPHLSRGSGCRKPAAQYEPDETADYLQTFAVDIDLKLSLIAPHGAVVCSYSHHESELIPAPP